MAKFVFLIRSSRSTYLGQREGRDAEEQPFSFPFLKGVACRCVDFSLLPRMESIKHGKFSLNYLKSFLRGRRRQKENEKGGQ